MPLAFTSCRGVVVFYSFCFVIVFKTRSFVAFVLALSALRAFVVGFPRHAIPTAAAS